MRLCTPAVAAKAANDAATDNRVRAAVILKHALGALLMQAALASGTLILTGQTAAGGVVSVLKAGAANWTTTQTPIATPRGFGLCTINNGSAALLIGGIIGGVESAAVQVCCQLESSI